MVVRSEACEKRGGAYGAQLGAELFTFSEDYRKFRTDSAAQMVFKAHTRDHVQHLESSPSYVTDSSQNRLQTEDCHIFFSDSSLACLSNVTVHTPSWQLRSSADTRIL